MRLFQFTTRTTIYLCVLGVLALVTIWGGTETHARMSFGAYKQIPATVVSSQVNRTSGGYRRRSRRSSNYEVQVTFQYDTPDGPAMSNRWSASEHEYEASGLNERGQAEKVKAAWYPGKQFMAYQSTTDPSLVVATNPSEGAVLYGILAGFGAAGMLGTILFMILLRDKNDPDDAWIEDDGAGQFRP